jgi:AcrR family transcriptional regulator
MTRELTLDDLTSFVTVARLTERTGLSNGAVYSAFAPEVGRGGRSRTAPQAVAREALVRRPLDTPLVEAQLAVLQEVVDRSATAGDLFPDELARLMAAILVDATRGSMASEYTQAWLVLAGGLRDDEVGARVRADYERWEGLYGRVATRVLSVTGREPVDGFDADSVAMAISATMDGAAQRLRCDPSVGEEFVVRLLMALWAGLTRPAGREDDLLEQRVTLGRPLELTGEEDAAVRAAVLRVHETAGWGAVTLRKVAQLSRVPVGRLVRRHPDRDHLAAVVWAELADGIERRARSVSGGGAGAEDRLPGLVRVLADVACGNRRLTASLLTARLRSPAPTDTGAGDAVTAVPGDAGEVVGRLVAVLRAGIEPPDPAGLRPALVVEAVLGRAASGDDRPEAITAAVLAMPGTSGVQ